MMSTTPRGERLPENSLQRLVRSRMLVLGLCEDELVARLPYAAADAARRNLWLCLERQVCARRILTALAGILELPLADLEAALASAVTERRAHEQQLRRKAFFPHLRVLTHHRPQCPAFVLGMTSLGEALSHLKLPHDIAAWSAEDRETLLAATVSGHWQRYGHGPVAQFCGGIAGYACHLRHGVAPLLLDPQGRALDPDSAAGWFSVVPHSLADT